jgi:hypothetical protein
MLRGGHRGVKSRTYRSATTKCSGKVIRQHNMKLPIVLQRDVGAVLVQAVGVKLLNVFSNEITVF